MVNETKKNSTGGDDEWSFEIDSSELKEKNNEARGEARTKARKPLVERKLRVEELKVEGRVSRTEMARKEGPLRVNKPDEHVPANIILRTVAFVVDFAFMGLLGAISFFAIDTTDDIYVGLLNTIKLSSSDTLSFEAVIGLNGIILYLLFFVIPTTISGKTLGKKLVGIKVRGIKYDGISFMNSIYREMILKPIGMGLVFGFFVPLFNKKFRGFHDYMAQTIVVKDNGKYASEDD
jgi:uncharacterized RDD family membrane protein YckC